VEGAAIVASRTICRSGIRKCFVRFVLVEWLRVAEVWVGRELSLRPGSIRQFLAAADALAAAYGFKAEKIDRCAIKIRRQQHADSATGQ